MRRLLATFALMTGIAVAAPLRAADLDVIRTRFAALTRPDAERRAEYPPYLIEQLDWHAGRILWQGVERSGAMDADPAARLEARRQRVEQLDVLTVACACPASRFYHSDRARQTIISLIGSLPTLWPASPPTSERDELLHLAQRVILWQARCGDALPPAARQAAETLIERRLAQLGEQQAPPPTNPFVGPMRIFLDALQRGDEAYVQRAADLVRMAAAEAARPWTATGAGFRAAFEAAEHLALFHYLTRGTSLALDEGNAATLTSALVLWQRHVLDTVGHLDPLVSTERASAATDDATPLCRAAGLALAAERKPKPSELTAVWGSLLPGPVSGAPPLDSASRVAAAVELAALGIPTAVAPRTRTPAVHYFLDAAYLAGGGPAGFTRVALPLAAGQGVPLTSPQTTGAMHIGTGTGDDDETYAAAATCWPGTTTRADLLAERAAATSAPAAEDVRSGGGAVLDERYGVAALALDVRRRDESLLRANKLWFVDGARLLFSVAGVAPPTQPVFPAWQTTPNAAGEAWLIILLNGTRRLQSLRLHFDSDLERLRHVPVGVLLQTSLDGVEWQGLEYRGTLPASGSSATLGLSRDLTFEPRLARYVRLRFSQGQGEPVALVEVEVFEPTASGVGAVDVAAAANGARVWASSAAEAHPVERVIDGVVAPSVPREALAVTHLALVARDVPAFYAKIDSDAQTMPWPETAAAVDLGRVAWLHDGKTGMRLLEAPPLQLRRLNERVAVVEYVHDDQPLLVEYLPGVTLDELARRADSPTPAVLVRTDQGQVLHDSTSDLTMGCVFGTLDTDAVKVVGRSAFLYRLRDGVLTAATAPDGQLTEWRIKTDFVRQVILNGSPLPVDIDNGYVILIRPPSPPVDRTPPPAAEPANVQRPPEPPARTESPIGNPQ